MSSLRLTPITLVAGDENPKISLQLKNNSSGQAYDLSGRQAYAVIVENGVTDTYVAKFPITTVSAALGKVQIDWEIAGSPSESYLDLLTAGKRYEMQLFVSRTDLPPLWLNVTVGAFTAVAEAAGKYLFTGEYLEGAPIYKHATEAYYLCRSSYNVPGYPYVWLNTVGASATWADVKDLDRTDLGGVPFWNFKYPIAEGSEAAYSQYPHLGGSPGMVAADTSIVLAGGATLSDGVDFTGGVDEVFVDNLDASAQDPEGRATQTVVTKIPLIIKAAFRLNL